MYVYDKTGQEKEATGNGLNMSETVYATDPRMFPLWPGGLIPYSQYPFSTMIGLIRP